MKPPEHGSPTVSNRLVKNNTSSKWSINNFSKSFLSLLTVPRALPADRGQGQGFTYGSLGISTSRGQWEGENNSTYLSLIYEVEASDAELTKVFSTHSQTAPNSSCSLSLILPITSSEWCCLSCVPLAVCLRPGSKHPGDKSKCLWDHNLLFQPAAGEGSFWTFRNDLTKIPQNECLAFGNENSWKCK